MERVQLPRLRRGTRPYKEAVERTRALVHARVAFYAKAYGISYGAISIRKQKTRWGSCSRAGNLSFNYRIGFLPPYLADYIIVHELCHIIEHNHSERFWAQVARVFPNPHTLRKQLYSGYTF